MLFVLIILLRPWLNSQTSCLYSNQILIIQVNITNIGDGTCKAEFKVMPEHTNKAGGLHGGFTATLVDSITTAALAAKDGTFGVTVNLNIKYKF